MAKDKKLGRIITIIFVVIFVIPCLLPVSYFFISPQVDLFVCSRIISHRIGTNPTAFQVRDYVTNYLDKNIVPGLSRDEVEARLGEVGHTKMFHDDYVLNGMTTDQIWFNVCFHPMNAIMLFAHYTADGKLILIEIAPID